MKRIIACLAVLLLCASLALPVAAVENEFTPSVTNKPAPEIVPVTDADGNSALGILYDDDGQIIGYIEEGCLVITAVADVEDSDEIPEDAKKLLLEIYEKLTSGEMSLPYEKISADMNSGNMVIRDLFDGSFLCGDHPELLAQEGVVLSATFDLGVKGGVDVVAMTYLDGEWVPVKNVVNNGDGTVTCTFEELCPVAFAVSTEDDSSATTGDLDINYGWLILAAVALVGIVVLTLVYRKSMKKGAAN